MNAAEAHRLEEERETRVGVGDRGFRGLGGERGEGHSILRKHSLRIRTGLQILVEGARAAEEHVERIAVLGPDERLAVERLLRGRLELGRGRGAARPRTRLVPVRDVTGEETVCLRGLAEQVVRAVRREATKHGESNQTPLSSVHRQNLLVQVV